MEEARRGRQRGKAKGGAAVEACLTDMAA